MARCSFAKDSWYTNDVFNNVSTVHGYLFPEFMMPAIQR